MAPPHEKLAASLRLLGDLQKGGRRVFRSDELPRTHRERLADHGFLAPIIKGWWMSADPDTPSGDSTSWYASSWEFCARYATERFGADWHLSPELSLLLHAEATDVPTQVVIYTPHGTNNTIELPFGTSLFDYAVRPARPLDPRAITVRDDELRLLTPAVALTRVQPAFFRAHPAEAQAALATIRDVSDVLDPLLEGGHSSVAGRLAGAFRRAGRGDFADEIVATMERAGYDARESDPFDAGRPLAAIRPRTSPIVARLESLWAAMREEVIDAFPDPPGWTDSPATYLRFVDEIYESDAYHSLSIEGYRVTPELVERVRTGEWDPDQDEDDGRSRDALAARGYWQAFGKVKGAVEKILQGEDPAVIARASHREWYRELFEPSVAAGLLDPTDLAGYRNHPVYIQDSRHVPPRAEVVRDAMPALFDLLEEEAEASVRAVLGHWLFGYIHPFPDGNGRIARFLMNTMLASGAYPWTVIRTEDRMEYMGALERASLDRDIVRFAELIARCVQRSIDRPPRSTTG